MQLCRVIDLNGSEEFSDAMLECIFQGYSECDTLVAQSEQQQGQEKVELLRKAVAIAKGCGSLPLPLSFPFPPLSLCTFLSLQGSDSASSIARGRE